MYSQEHLWHNRSGASSAQAAVAHVASTCHRVQLKAPAGWRLPALCCVVPTCAASWIQHDCLLHATCTVSTTNQLIGHSQEDLLSATSAANVLRALDVDREDPVHPVCVEATVLPWALLNAAHRGSSIRRHTAHVTYSARRLMVLLLHDSCRLCRVG